MHKVSLLTFYSISVLHYACAMGWGLERAYLILRGAGNVVEVGNTQVKRLSWEVVGVFLIGSWLLNCKMLLCYIRTEDKQWELRGLCEDVPQGKCDYFVCLWLFFMKAGNDLKRALSCFGNSYFIGIFCSV